MGRKRERITITAERIRNLLQNHKDWKCLDDLSIRKLIVQEFHKMFGDELTCEISHHSINLAKSDSPQVFENYAEVKREIKREESAERLRQIREKQQREANERKRKKELDAQIERDKAWRNIRDKAISSEMEYIRNSKSEDACSRLLELHRELLEDDPNRLSTEFIASLSGCSCPKRDLKR